MTADAELVLAELRRRNRGISARSIAEALGWHKKGDGVPRWEHSKDRRKSIWDEHRAHVAARQLEADGLVEVRVSAKSTRYVAVREK